MYHRRKSRAAAAHGTHSPDRRRLLQFAGLPLTAHEESALQVAAACNLRLFGCANHELVSDYLSYRVHELGGVR